MMYDVCSSVFCSLNICNTSKKSCFWNDFDLKESFHLLIQDFSYNNTMVFRSYFQDVYRGFPISL